MIEKNAQLGHEIEPKFIKVKLESFGNPQNCQKMLFFEEVDF